MDEIKQIIYEAREKGCISLDSYCYKSTTYEGANWVVIREAQEALSQIKQIIDKHEQNLEK